MILKKDEIVFLLGAGASVDANIPASCGMIEKLENLLSSNEAWRSFAPLYHFIKSAVIYADGIKGKFDNSNLNIERLVNTLDELLKSDEHPLFPFIGAWTPKLPEVTGNDFKKIRDFRKMIVEELSHQWVRLEYDEYASYFSGLSRFQKEYNYPLRVFTLNYDLCVEKACLDCGVERGFGDEKNWDWRIFDNEDQIERNILLYKLHGSIDWMLNERGVLTYKDSNIQSDKLAIIFGTTYKLQYIDPFLFFAYEFRKWTLSESKIIVCVGYGFGDEHINGIIAQALNRDASRRLLVVRPCQDKDEEVQFITKCLGVPAGNNIILQKSGAKEFFENQLSLEMFIEIFPDDESPFDEIIREN